MNKPIYLLSTWDRSMLSAPTQRSLKNREINVIARLIGFMGFYYQSVLILPSSLLKTYINIVNRVPRFHETLRILSSSSRRYPVSP